VPIACLVIFAVVEEFGSYHLYSFVNVRQTELKLVCHVVHIYQQTSLTETNIISAGAIVVEFLYLCAAILIRGSVCSLPPFASLRSTTAASLF